MAMEKPTGARLSLEDASRLHVERAMNAYIRDVAGVVGHGAGPEPELRAADASCAQLLRALDLAVAVRLIDPEGTGTAADHLITAWARRADPARG